MQGFLQNVKQIGVFEERPTAKAFVFKNAYGIGIAALVRGVVCPSHAEEGI
jgi:hypothetical protein